MKDNFSLQSKYYSQYRPDYPGELYELIFSKVKHFDRAWDCATGNGQVAKVLSQHFAKVDATDISEKQLMSAVPAKNIFYQTKAAESTDFEDQSFDLITVGQALHWFDFIDFFAEVDRLLKPGGVFATWGYGLNRINPEVDAIILDFYENILGNYWDNERNYIDNKYNEIPFPEMNWEEHFIDHTFQWDLEHFLGYLYSWSAVQKYIQKKDRNPIDIIKLDLSMKWKKQKLNVVFPIFLRIGVQ